MSLARMFDSFSTARSLCLEQLPFPMRNEALFQKLPAARQRKLEYPNESD